MYHNVLAQTSQTNFLQQQPQSNNGQQPGQWQQYYCYPSNQQSSSQKQYGQCNPQEWYGPPQGMSGGGIQRANVGFVPMQQGQTYSTVPTFDQTRPYVIGPPSACSGPIFILPTNCPNPSQSAIVPNMSPILGCPGIGINCPSSLSPISGMEVCPNSCGAQQRPTPGRDPRRITNTLDNCGCYSQNPLARRYEKNEELTEEGASMMRNHRCFPSSDDTICTEKSCPSAINLQALASQLLGIPGIVPCAATRLVLRKIAGSNITTNAEETVERAKRSLQSLTKEQLLAETRAAQQVNALINLHMTANPPINVIPVLTTIQLKVNLLKSMAEALVNRRLSENQGYGAEAPGNLDSVMLATKSDEELRQLLGTLRQKECDERVNLSFAPYHSQRIIAESRLCNVRNKISQVEEEIGRRRATVVPFNKIGPGPNNSPSAWYGYTGDPENCWTGYQHQQQANCYDSPDPFRAAVQIRTPKRLNLKAHVGSPETSYERSNKANNTPITSKPPPRSKSRISTKHQDAMSDDDDYGDDFEKSAPGNKNRCNCDKSSEDDSADEAKKKLAEINHGQEKTVRLTNRPAARANKGLSFIELSPELTMVIDCDNNEYYFSIDDSLENYFDEDWDEPVREFDSSHSDNNKETAPLTGNEETTIKEYDLETNNNNDNNNYSNNNNNNNNSNKVNTYETGETASPPLSTETPKRFKWRRKIKHREEVIKKVESSIVVNENDDETSIYEEALTTPLEILENVKKDESNFDKAETKNSGSKLKKSNSNLKSSGRQETVRMITNIQYEPSAFLDLREDGLKGDEGNEDKVENKIGEENSSLSTANSSETESSINERTSEDRGSRDPNTNPSEPISMKMSGKRIENRDESRGDPISGALSTIGNHVASFTSIIGKIASLKLHRSEETHPEETSRSTRSRNIEDAVSDNGKRIEETREIGKWRYIRFSDGQRSSERINCDENSTYTLPKIKHSVIEDKKRNRKYVVMDKSSKDRGLGEPYKTGRSLVIRSHPKDSQRIKESGPFTVVPAPKRDKNSIALSLVNVGSLIKNRRTNTMRSSQKFWLKPSRDSNLEPRTLSSGSRGDLDKCALYSASRDEYVLNIHDYYDYSIL